VLLATVLATNAEIASKHDTAVQTINNRTETGLEVIASAMTALAASSSALEEQVVSVLNLARISNISVDSTEFQKQAHRSAVEFEKRQGVLEKVGTRFPVQVKRANFRILSNRAWSEPCIFCRVCLPGSRDMMVRSVKLVEKLLLCKSL
jgi:hypothetical protein